MVDGLLDIQLYLQVVHLDQRTEGQAEELVAEVLVVEDREGLAKRFVLTR